jgi:hypothetical protein
MKTKNLITQEQLEILRHTAYRAAGGLYCGGGVDMDYLARNGLMRCVGWKSFVPDPYFVITEAGHDILKANPQ